MPQLTTFFIQNGIPEYALVWMFMIPIAMTVVVAARQIVGVKGLGVIAPILLGFAFTATGAKYGLIMFLVALIATFVMRSLLSRVRLLYLPKMGLLLSGVAVSVMFAASVVPYREEVQFPQAAFSLIIFILLVEQFASHLIERGPRETFNAALHTLVLSLAVFFVVTWDWLNDAVVSYPLFVLAAVVISNFVLGKWTGLRVVEYIRFKDLIFK